MASPFPTQSFTPPQTIRSHTQRLFMRMDTRSLFVSPMALLLGVTFRTGAHSFPPPPPAQETRIAGKNRVRIFFECAAVSNRKSEGKLAMVVGGENAKGEADIFQVVDAVDARRSGSFFRNHRESEKDDERADDQHGQELEDRESFCGAAGHDIY